VAQPRFRWLQDSCKRNCRAGKGRASGHPIGIGPIFQAASDNVAEPSRRSQDAWTLYRRQVERPAIQPSPPQPILLPLLRGFSVAAAPPARACHAGTPEEDASGSTLAPHALAGIPARSSPGSPRLSSWPRPAVAVFPKPLDARCQSHSRSSPGFPPVSIGQGRGHRGLDRWCAP
jgi:hypothetical protein